MALPANEYVEISAGPGKWDLSIGLFEDSKQLHFTVRLPNGSRERLTVRVDSVKRHSVIRHGRPCNVFELEGLILMSDPPWTDFKAYFVPRSRQGILKATHYAPPEELPSLAPLDR